MPETAEGVLRGPDQALQHPSARLLDCDASRQRERLAHQVWPASGSVEIGS